MTDTKKVKSELEGRDFYSECLEVFILLTHLTRTSEKHLSLRLSLLKIQDPVKAASSSGLMKKYKTNSGYYVGFSQQHCKCSVHEVQLPRLVCV